MKNKDCELSRHQYPLSLLPHSRYTVTGCPTLLPFRDGLQPLAVSPTHPFSHKLLLLVFCQETREATNQHDSPRPWSPRISLVLSLLLGFLQFAPTSGSHDGLGPLDPLKLSFYPFLPNFLLLKFTQEDGGLLLLTLSLLHCPLS